MPVQHSSKHTVSCRCLVVPQLHSVQHTLLHTTTTAEQPSTQGLTPPSQSPWGSAHCWHTHNNHACSSAALQAAQSWPAIDDLSLNRQPTHIADHKHQMLLRPLPGSHASLLSQASHIIVGPGQGSA